MGWENLFHCEFNPFCQRILKYYWPDSKSYGDITKSTFTEFRGRITILTGGFPCQPFSTAGKRKGTDDSRYLWPEMLRVIREVQPRYIVGENVRGLVSWDGGLVFDTVCSDLEAEGYEVLPILLPAASVNAPHKRDRIWFIAHSNNKGGSSGLGQVQSENGEISERNNDAEFSDSSNGNASDTDCSPTEYKIQTRRDLFTSKIARNIITDTNSNSERSSGKSGRIKKSRSENNDEQNQWGSKTEQHTGFVDVSKYASDTDSRNNKTRTQREILGQSDWKKTNGYSNVECTNKWQNFPTVSPICNGDDGLSNRLDSITFSKWRNESIKGGGNAIVPNVALEIFKVIQKIEENEYRQNSQS